MLEKTTQHTLNDLGLLILRLAFGGLMLTHGFPKLMAFSERADTFPDPLGVGHVLSMTLAVSAEFFCAIALVLGLGTRLVAIPLLITMLVAAFVVHGDDPFKKQELALLYAFPYLALILTGGGRFSLDALLAPFVRKARGDKSATGKEAS